MGHKNVNEYEKVVSHYDRQVRKKRVKADKLRKKKINQTLRR